MDLIDNCTRSRGKLNRNSYCSWSHSNSTHSNQWMERIEEEMIYIHSISIVCVENCRLIHGLNDTEVSLVTPVSLLSKPILDLFQIQWAFHWMNLNWIGSIRIPVRITSCIIPILILKHRIVQEMMEDQFMISICMDMKGMWNGLLSHPMASFPDPSILLLYLMYHRVHTTHPSFPCHSVPSLLQPRQRSHPHHRPFQLACLSSGISSRVSRRSFG